MVQGKTLSEKATILVRKKMYSLRLQCLPGTKSAMLVRSIAPYSPLVHFTHTPKPLFATATATATANTRLLATFATSTAVLQTLAPHPWPEWVSFVDLLMSRGYFPRAHNEPELLYRELKLLKDPCLTFARHRYHIFESLSKDDIRNIVEVGCPKLLRKVVNSAKRLRVYVGLQEKSVCDACSLKGSCDRAYLKPNESESIKTVDIMRLLLFYAVDPMVISEAVRPTSIERAEFSARRLLRMLMDLSDPAFTEPPDNKEKIANSTATVLSEDTERWKGEWVCPKCSFLNYSRNTQCRKCSEDGPKKQESALVEPKKGDWNCPKCKFSNFAKNVRCRQCNEDAPKKRERKHVEPKKGDWHCPQCNFLNYSRNMQCRKCNEGAPEKRERGHVEPKKGDWDCPQCGFVNFASRTNCLECTATRPAQSLNTGEWVCSKCSFLNFRRNVTCLKCDGEQVKDAGAVHEQHIWKKPIPGTIS